MLFICNKGLQFIIEHFLEHGLRCFRAQGDGNLACNVCRLVQRLLERRRRLRVLHWFRFWFPWRMERFAFSGEALQFLQVCACSSPSEPIPAEDDTNRCFDMPGAADEVVGEARP